MYAAAAIVVAACAIGAGVYAAQPRDNDASAITTAKLDLVQAIIAAEKHVGGKAVSAEFERDKGQFLFEIEVIKDKTVVDVKIDAETGNVISAVED